MIIIAEKVIFLPQFVGRRVLGGCAAVILAAALRLAGSVVF